MEVVADTGFLAEVVTPFPAADAVSPVAERVAFLGAEDAAFQAARRTSTVAAGLIAAGIPIEAAMASAEAIAVTLAHVRGAVTI